MAQAAVPDLVGRVILRAAADTPAVRMSARERLGRERLKPHGSTDHEILVVRSLSWTPGRPGQAGGDDLGAQLDTLRRTAVPLDGRPVPVGARAVVAADLAQLLAQYVVDGHDHALAAHWWWRELAGRFPHGSAAAVLAAYPAESPHAIVELASRRRLDVLAASTVEEVRRLAAAVATAYAAPRLAELLDPGLAAPRPEGGENGCDGQPVGAASRRQPPPRPDAAAAVELLVVVATQVAADPARARLPEFVEFVGVLAAGRTETRHAGGGHAGRLDQQPTPARGDLRSDSGGPRESGAVAASQPPAELSGSSTASGSRGAGARAVARPEADAPEPSAVGLHVVPSPATGDMDRRLFDVDPGPRSRADAALASAVGRTTTGIHTGLGGVFFLVGAASALGIPDDFEDGWQLAGTLGAWGAVDALARSILEDQALIADPVWRVLEDLGRGPLVERASALPLRGQLPPAWRDLPTVPAPALGATLASNLHRGLGAWLLLVRPRVLAWLSDRLGDRLSVPAGEVPALLLEHPARVRHDRTHVDVAFPLSGANLAVRRAGLDRDPGWVPAFGRVVSYVFDDDAYAGDGR